jgi:hypothetical protein
MILGWPLPKLCPLIPTSNQDGHQAKNRKRGDEILIVHCCFSVSQNELKLEISIFSNSGHLEWRAGAVGHNFERDPPRDHPCQVWFNLVQRFQRRRLKCEKLTDDGKSSHCLWQGKLKRTFLNKIFN